MPTRRPRVLAAEVAEGPRFLWGHAGVRSQTVIGFLLSFNTAGRMLSFGVGWTGGALVASALAGAIGQLPRRDADLLTGSGGPLARCHPWAWA